MKIANRRRADRAAAAQLDAYYDELASGVLAPRRDLVDPDIAAIASQIHDTGRRLAAPDNLKTQLWEDLMDSATLTSQHDATPQSRRTLSSRQDARPAPRATPWNEPISARHGHLLRWMATVMVIIGLAGTGLLVRSHGDDGGQTPQPHADMSAPFTSSPVARIVNGDTPPVADCTTPFLRVGEISGIVTNAAIGSELGSDMRDLPLTAPNMTTSAPPLPAGTPVDAATHAAIAAVYHTYGACMNAGSIRQAYWLFTNDGIARQLIPNGHPLYPNIAVLAVPPTPFAQDRLQTYPPLINMVRLPDGRVAAYWELPGQLPSQVNYLLFREFKGQWLIDDIYQSH